MFKNSSWKKQMIQWWYASNQGIKQNEELRNKESHGRITGDVSAFSMTQRGAPWTRFPVKQMKIVLKQHLNSLEIVLSA